MSNLIKEWQPLPYFESKYLISNYGEVKNIATGLIKKPVVMAGYLYIGLSVGNRKTKSFRLHRLVAIVFIPNPDNLPQVNHKDCNKLNPRADNLEWCTHDHNTKHRDENDLGAKGSQVAASKLKESDIVTIRQMRSTGLKYGEIAPIFKVNKSVICAICLRKAWRHVA